MYFLGLGMVFVFFVYSLLMVLILLCSSGFLVLLFVLVMMSDSLDFNSIVVLNSLFFLDIFFWVFGVMLSLIMFNKWEMSFWELFMFF